MKYLTSEITWNTYYLKMQQKEGREKTKREKSKWQKNERIFKREKTNSGSK